MADLADVWLIFFHGAGRRVLRLFLLRNAGPVQTGTHSFREMLAVSGVEKIWGSGIEVGELSLMATVFLFHMPSVANLYADLPLRHLQLLFRSLSLPSCL